MEWINLEIILKEIPLFAKLREPDLGLIKERSLLQEYKKGQVIYQEGAPADAFYCVVLGRVVIYTQDENNQEKALEYLHRGKYFGIISLLTGGNHSVTARAVNDCLLLIIKKEDFELTQHHREMLKADKEKLELMQRIDVLEKLIAKLRRGNKF